MAMSVKASASSFLAYHFGFPSCFLYHCHSHVLQGSAAGLGVMPGELVRVLREWATVLVRKSSSTLLYFQARFTRHWAMLLQTCFWTVTFCMNLNNGVQYRLQRTTCRVWVRQSRYLARDTPYLWS